MNFDSWTDPELDSYITNAADTKLKMIRLLATKLPMLSSLGNDFKPGSRKIRRVRRNEGLELLMKSSNGCKER